jgi:hypothetical protein
MKTSLDKVASNSQSEKKVYHRYALGVMGDRGKKQKHPYTEVGFIFDKDK